MVSTTPLIEADPELDELIRKETARKELSLELIPSENCVSEAVLEAQGSILTDKYAEGYPGARYYGGCVYHDEIENLAIERAKKMFGAKFANVQPHSGSNANMAAIFALTKMGDTIMGAKLDHGGHLTHGSKVNFSGKYYNIVGYGVNPETETFHEEDLMAIAKESKPKLIICGATAYAPQLDWQMFRRVADSVGALLMADVAHYAGLIVGGAYPNPVGIADVVTTTTHKTLRGPRGGLVVTNDEKIIKKVNKMVFPGIQGGPLMHQIGAKAVAFKETLTPEFKTYAKNVIDNARALASNLQESGYKIVSNKTDSHVMIVDLRPNGLTGDVVEEALGKVGITVNKNTVPDDPNPPKVTSGVRLGTPAITSRGFDTADMKTVADCFVKAIQSRDNEAGLALVREEIIELCKRRPLFPHRLV